MKHIKRFKLFESFDEEIKSYLSQIFLELEDEGYDVDIEGRWLRTEGLNSRFKINISGKDIGEDVLPSIETSISYMSSQDFSRYFIKIPNFGILNIDELKSYLNLKKSLANPPKTTIELNFRKV